MTTATIIPERVEALRAVVPATGKHSAPAKARKSPPVGCEVELLSWMAGMPWSDHTPCISPVIASFLRAWNDNLDDDGRQRLHLRCLDLGGAITSTGGDGHEEERGWLAMDWLVRTFTPAWLELAGIAESAAALRTAPPFLDPAAVEVAKPLISAADSAADSTAYSAACSAADSAARSAAYSAAYSAADSAADSAAYSAARSAADSAADSAAYSAARSAAYSAAYSAARSAACSAAYSAAYSAADSALEPTKVALQATALDLLSRMVMVGREAVAA